MTLFSWGDDPSPDTAAPYAHVSRPVGVGSGAGSTSTMDKVASLEANAFGLYDMHGSVWEWTSTGLDDAAHIRGGSWMNTVVQARSSNIARLPATVRHPHIGVRLVLVP